MIVGTAGHIDHGKSALVKAITGVDTDRLKEEKVRGISIDLGFAYMPAGDESMLGFVDVPGHEKFIRNMLAGASGIDLVLLVVAADDGIMPQTLEHLAIVDLLGKSEGLVALTKADLVSPERRQEVDRDIAELLASTGLAERPIFHVSAATGEGIDELREALIAAAMSSRERKEKGRFRLAVDRCFSIAGVGTIVTGAVVSGAVSVGDNVTVSPIGLNARVRSIHAQNRPAEQGHTGQRCALNLSGDGVTRHAVSRGDFVVDPFLHAPVERIDASLQLLSSETKPIRHWTPVRLYHGAAEVPGRVALLEEAPIAPGTGGRIQLALDRPIAAAVGDRFILRDTSGARTLGGGHLIDLRAPRRRRKTALRLAQLEALGQENPATALALSLDRWPFYVNLANFARDRALSDTELEAVLMDLPHKPFGKAPEAYAVSSKVWQQLENSARTAIEAFHKAHPQLLGLSAARLAALVEPRLPRKIALAVMNALVEANVLASTGGALRAPDHRLGLDKTDQTLWSRVAPLLADEARFRPPRVGDIAQELKEREFDVRRVLKAMARQRSVIEIAPDHFLLRETMKEIAGIIGDLATLEPEGHFSAAQLRDRLNNGRKVSIQILEYFDRNGMTLRREDLRTINAGRLNSFASASD